MNSSFVLYIISGIFYCGIAYIFHKAVDGNLRKSMIFTFLSAGFGMMLRGISFFLNENFRFEYEHYLSFIIVLPALVSGMFGFFYLYFKFYLKDKNLNNYIKENSKKK